MVRSMVVGAGAAAKAYVLSNYNPGLSQHLIAFDPLTPPTTAAIWVKMTLVTGSGYYGHLGLAFGRGE